MLGCIYGIKNIEDGKIMYVGQTIRSLEDRFCEHKLRKGKNKNKFDMLNRYPEMFTIEIINIFSEEQLDFYEAYYIKKYNTYEEGWNLTKGNYKSGECLSFVDNLEDKNMLEEWNIQMSIYKEYELSTARKRYHENAEYINIRYKEYYYKNIDKMRERVRKYRLNNLEKCKENRKNYYKNNKEKEQINNSVYRKLNKEKIATKKLEYNVNNKEKIREYTKGRYQKTKLYCRLYNMFNRQYYKIKHINSVELLLIYIDSDLCKLTKLFKERILEYLDIEGFDALQHMLCMFYNSDIDKGDGDGE